MYPIHEYERAYKSDSNILTVDTVKYLIDNYDYLNLDSIELIEIDAALMLAKFEGAGQRTPEKFTRPKVWTWRRPVISMNGLKNINSDTANALSKFKGHLQLNGLESLTPLIISCLTSEKLGSLSLNGLKSISPEQAAAFKIKDRNELSLFGLNHIDSESAKILSDVHSTLMLDGLTDLSDDAASSLANNFKLLSLNGITNLTTSAAHGLKKTQGKICLNGLTDISEEALLLISDIKGRLCLNRVSSISNNAAKHLLPKCISGNLEIEMDKVFASQVENEYIKSIMIYMPADIVILELHDTFLSSIAAKAIVATNTDQIILPDLRQLDPEIAQILANAPAKIIYLDQLRKITYNISKPLLSVDGKIISLDGSEMDSKTIDLIGKYKGTLFISGIKALSPYFIDVLKNAQGEIVLWHLECLEQNRPILSLNKNQHIYRSRYDFEREVVVLNTLNGGTIEVSLFFYRKCRSFSQRIKSKSGCLIQVIIFIVIIWLFSR